MVRLAAQSMGLSVEIWRSPGRHAQRLTLGPGCTTCEQREPRIFDRCRKRRSYLTRREAPIPEQLAEKCPLKLRLARLGPVSGASGPTLFAFGYGSTPESPEEMDARVLSFLRDLRTLLVDRRRGELEFVQVESGGEESEEMSLLYSVSGWPQQASDLRSESLRVLDEYRAVAGAQCALVWHRERALLEACFEVEPSPERREEIRQHWSIFARRQADSLAASGAEDLIEQLPGEHPVSRSLGSATECISVPLRVHGGVRGVLCALRPTQELPIDSAELRLLKSLGGQLGLAISNADLYESLNGFLANTVRTLVSAIDAKDAYTCGHSERVNIVSMLVGHEMDLALEDLEALYWGSLLHDVGKIGMPESILNKPCSLDPNEVQVVKEHPERGWEMLHAIEQLRRAADGVRYHHERWDGTGYRAGLAAHDIPVIARIIAVADAFDAVLSNRSYRKGQSAEEAVARIAEGAGTQFDPDVVDALQRLLPLLQKHQWVLLSGQKSPASA
jgi:HD-GYP domain-containing protein (c-di-GMP phosphodiesterase class II)